MFSSSVLEASGFGNSTMGGRSLSSQGLRNEPSSPSVKIPLPPRLWITDIEKDSSEESELSVRDDSALSVSRSRLRTRMRLRDVKQRSASVPIGIFWDIENCQVPRGCSAIDVVSAIRGRFLTGGRREADFVVVCDVRKESLYRIQELNDAQISLIHVCGTQKNAADEKLRQCMRRFGELHAAPAALILISGDINFAADLSDFRYRKNIEVILVHKQNTSTALITCANSHYDYNELTANVPRNPKTLSQTEEDEEPRCEMEVANLPTDQPPERVGRRLRRLADNCGGKVLRVTASTALLRFPTPDHAHRALKRMDGEDVFGRKISTRYARSVLQPAYSSDEGYGTGPQPQMMIPPAVESAAAGRAGQWARAIQQLPQLPQMPQPQLPQMPQPQLPQLPANALKPRQIRGTHGDNGVGPVRACSSPSSRSVSRAASPWNGSVSSEPQDDSAELSVTNLPNIDPNTLQEMLTQLFSQFVPVIRVSVWAGSEGPVATVALRSEWDARLCIARVHKRRLAQQWAGRRLELALGRPSPQPHPDVLRARLRAILLEHPNYTLPLLSLRDVYASRHCMALTTADLNKVKDTVIILEGYGRMVQLLTPLPPNRELLEEAPWKCHLHANANTTEDGSRILQPVYIEVATLAKQVMRLLDSHGGILPLLSFVECYESMFRPLIEDMRCGVPLELLLRNIAGVEIRDQPSRHLVRRVDRDTPSPEHLSCSSSSSSFGTERSRTAPALEPMLALFERDLVDLLRSAPQCCIVFSKLIPMFHHHFGRQCRVADYGFTKLPDLLAALPNTVVVLGSGSSRIITISAPAQARRWTSDLTKVLRAQGRPVPLRDIPMLYETTFGVPFSCANYGVCTLPELMQRVQEPVMLQEGMVALPRRSPTTDERLRGARFAREAIELLCYTPNLRIEFSRFVPAYHAHFSRQLRVAHFGCTKLAELFEMVPEAIELTGDPNGERMVRLTVTAAKAVMIQRLQAIAPLPMSAFPTTYATTFGGTPLPDCVGVSTLSELVYACGGCVRMGVVRAPGDAPHWATEQLLAAAVLAADPSVASRSTMEYFISAFRRSIGTDPDVPNLAVSGVIELVDERVGLTTAWRVVWRVACLLGERGMTVSEILQEYMRRYDPAFCQGVGTDGVVEFLREHCSVFLENNGVWNLCLGVNVTFGTRTQRTQREDFTIMDTPPGQKGSRVFESPKAALIREFTAWCSPPASALPVPTALLDHDVRRTGRTRLAAQFGINSTGNLPLINKDAFPVPTVK